jgi:hypothetical protein
VEDFPQANAIAKALVKELVKFEQHPRRKLLLRTKKNP